MTKKRIKHELIANKSKRNATYATRREGLLKKASELSILCGVEIGIVAHIRGVEDNAIVWPSPQIFMERMQRFLNIPEIDRDRRMVINERYMEQATNEEAQNSSKLKKIVETKESHLLMNELMARQIMYLNELHLSQLNGLNSLIDEKMREVEIRDMELNGGPLSALAPPPPPPPPPSFSSGTAVAEASSFPPVLENLRNDDQYWFVDPMSQEHDITDFLEAQWPPEDGGGAAGSSGGGA